MALFAAFAVITQLQFSRISDDKIYDARVDTYESDLRSFEVAEKAHSDCIISIETREVYRAIFAGISSLLQRQADLILELFPQSPKALAYRDESTRGIEEFITSKVTDGLPPKLPEDCPPKPTDIPEKPKR